ARQGLALTAPDQARLAAALARALCEIGDAPSAVVEGERAVHLCERDAQAWQALAQALAAAGGPLRSGRAAERAAALVEEEGDRAAAAQAHGQAARAWERAEQLDQALAAHRRALELCPESERPRTLLAVAKLAW